MPYEPYVETPEARAAWLRKLDSRIAARRRQTLQFDNDNPATPTPAEKLFAAFGVLGINIDPKHLALFNKWAAEDPANFNVLLAGVATAAACKRKYEGASGAAESTVETEEETRRKVRALKVVDKAEQEPLSPEEAAIVRAMVKGKKTIGPDAEPKLYPGGSY